MEQRLRNLLNWVAFGLLLLYLYNGVNYGSYFFGTILWFERTILPWTGFGIERLNPELLAGTVMIYLYMAYLGAQYVIWKKVVVLPWRFKVEDE